MAKEAELKRKRDEEESQQKHQSYETKKEMARETRKNREMAETKAAEMRRRFIRIAAFVDEAVVQNCLR